jgi:hypothetical protein
MDSEQAKWVKSQLEAIAGNIPGATVETDSSMAAGEPPEHWVTIPVSLATTGDSAAVEIEPTGKRGVYDVYVRTWDRTHALASEEYQFETRGRFAADKVKILLSEIEEEGNEIEKAMGLAHESLGDGS